LPLLVASAQAWFPGKRGQAVEDRLQPDAVDARRREAFQIAVGVRIEVRFEQRVAVEGEVRGAEAGLEGRVRRRNGAAEGRGERADEAEERIADLADFAAKLAPRQLRD